MEEQLQEFHIIHIINLSASHTTIHLLHRLREFYFTTINTTKTITFITTNTIAIIIVF